MNTVMWRARIKLTLGSPQIVAAAVRVPPPAGPPVKIVVVVVVEVIVAPGTRVEPAVLLPLEGVALANPAIDTEIGDFPSKELRVGIPET